MRLWDIYDITAPSPIHGVKLRGRLRKFAISKGIELLTENATDTNNTVRFALEDPKNKDAIYQFIYEQVEDAKIAQVMEGVTNPVLSKLKVNITDRYEL